jgi:hypothetical protein
MLVEWFDDDFLKCGLSFFNPHLMKLVPVDQIDRSINPYFRRSRRGRDEVDIEEM